MRLEWIILHPAAPYAALVIGMGLCLFLFTSLKRDLHAGEERSKKKLAALETDCRRKRRSWTSAGTSCRIFRSSWFPPRRCVPA